MRVSAGAAAGGSSHLRTAARLVGPLLAVGPRPQPAACAASAGCRTDGRHSTARRLASLLQLPSQLAGTYAGGEVRLHGRRSRHARLEVQMCGIIGIYKFEGTVSPELFEGLLMLQHRGQDSAGMVTTSGRKFFEHKDNGLVNDVFSAKTMSKLEGNVGIGHVRYPTAGSASAQEAQPFFVNSPLGIYLIHNGNLTNVDALRHTLEDSQSFFNRHLRTESDSEVLLNVLADEIHRAHQRCMQSGSCDPLLATQELVFEAGASTMRMLQGAYSCLCLIKSVGLVAFRDPCGIRPLVLGQRISEARIEYCIASEDCAFGPIGFQRVRDIAPGEMLIITPEGEVVSRQCVPGRHCPCVFEYIYLARPDSVLDDIPVYNFQLGLGTRLARRIRDKGWDIDCVVPVPDGSRPAAIQISAELGLPYREGLVKNRYVGRTFIMPDQRMRELSVRRKLNAMPAVFAGKRVLLVDDSIVRGTTMSQIVDMVRRAGASKVYLASASPPVRHANVYGVDMPTRREFVAFNLSEEEICTVLGADGMLYQTTEDLLSVGHELNPSIEQFEASCFNGAPRYFPQTLGALDRGIPCGWQGVYVTHDISDEYLLSLESSARGKDRLRPGRSISLLREDDWGSPGAAATAPEPTAAAA